MQNLKKKKRVRISVMLLKVNTNLTYCCDISDVPPAEAPFRNVVLSLVGVGACLRTPIPMLELQTMLARHVTTLNNLSSG